MVLTGLGLSFFQKSRHKTHMSLPVFVSCIHGHTHRGILHLRPVLKKVFFEAEIRRRTGPVNNMQLAEILPVLHTIVDQRTYRGQSDTAADKENVFSFEKDPGENNYRKAPGCPLPGRLPLHGGLPLKCRPFDGKFQVIFALGSNGKHGFPLPAAKRACPAVPAWDERAYPHR